MRISSGGTTAVRRHPFHVPSHAGGDPPAWPLPCRRIAASVVEWLPDVTTALADAKGQSWSRRSTRHPHFTHPTDLARSSSAECLGDSPTKSQPGPSVHVLPDTSIKNVAFVGPHPLPRVLADYLEARWSAPRSR